MGLLRSFLLSLSPFLFTTLCTSAPTPAATSVPEPLPTDGLFNTTALLKTRGLLSARDLNRYPYIGKYPGPSPDSVSCGDEPDYGFPDNPSRYDCLQSADKWRDTDSKDPWDGRQTEVFGSCVTYGFHSGFSPLFASLPPPSQRSLSESFEIVPVRFYELSPGLLSLLLPLLLLPSPSLQSFQVSAA